MLYLPFLQLVSAKFKTIFHSPSQILNVKGRAIGIYEKDI